MSEIVNSATGEVYGNHCRPMGSNGSGAVLVTTDRVDAGRRKAADAQDVFSRPGGYGGVGGRGDRAEEQDSVFCDQGGLRSGMISICREWRGSPRADGQFRAGTFAAYVVPAAGTVEPVARLAKDSGMAARNLSRELKRFLAKMQE